MINRSRLLDQLRAWLDRLLGGQPEPALAPVPVRSTRPRR
jgi:hypothetical protein